MPSGLPVNVPPTAPPDVLLTMMRGTPNVGTLATPTVKFAPAAIDTPLATNKSLSVPGVFPPMVMSRVEAGVSLKVAIDVTI
jgi:hypothetical protein